MSTLWTNHFYGVSDGERSQSWEGPITTLHLETAAATWCPLQAEVPVLSRYGIEDRTCADYVGDLSHILNNETLATTSLIIERYPQDDGTTALVILLPTTHEGPVTIPKEIPKPEHDAPPQEYKRLSAKQLRDGGKERHGDLSLEFHYGVYCIIDCTGVHPERRDMVIWLCLVAPDLPPIYGPHLCTALSSFGGFTTRTYEEREATAKSVFSRGTEVNPDGFVLRQYPYLREARAYLAALQTREGCLAALKSAPAQFLKCPFQRRVVEMPEKRGRSSNRKVNR